VLTGKFSRAPGCACANIPAVMKTRGRTISVLLLCLAWSLCLSVAVPVDSVPSRSERREIEPEEADAFIELLTHHEALQTEPRCGRDFANVTCSSVGKKGSCCSKWGFCGNKPFHCVRRLGCQSECNDDMDFKDLSEHPPEAPVPVVFAPSDKGPKVIIKTLSPAVPICPRCNQSVNTTIIRLIKNADILRKLSPDAVKLANDILGGGKVKVNLTDSKDGDDGTNGKLGELDYIEAIKELRKMSKNFKKMADKVIKNAKKAALKIAPRPFYDMSQFPTASNGNVAISVSVTTPHQNPHPAT